MASYQRVALFIFFDAVEQDLTSHLRRMSDEAGVALLNDEERSKATTRMKKRDLQFSDQLDETGCYPGLDLGDKFNVILRNKRFLDTSSQQYFASKKPLFEKAITVRNATMHGRPLTTTEYAFGFAMAEEFVAQPRYWPTLNRIYTEYAINPQSLTSDSIVLLDENTLSGTLNNLPPADYEDTVFLPRPDLEKDLKRKLLGRHPVITILGDGGNGKTALALQTLYSLIDSNDHDFDAIAWVSAKASRLTGGEIERIEGAITSSLGIFEAIADAFEGGDDEPIVRVRRLMCQNKVLLAIDNLETVIDDSLRDFAADIPGESKLLFTSRVPLGSDLSVKVGELSEGEARAYMRRLVGTYNISQLSKLSNDQIDRYAKRLGRKPLLLKWFALGVASGLQPDRIVTNPETALRFCLENVINSLSDEAKNVASVFSVVSGSISSAVIEETGRMSTEDVEAGLAELLMPRSYSSLGSSTWPSSE